MDYKEAVEILIKLSGKRSLKPAEKEAVLTAIGVLSWATLAKSRLKRLKTKRDKRGMI